MPPNDGRQTLPLHATIDTPENLRCVENRPHHAGLLFDKYCDAWRLRETGPIDTNGKHAAAWLSSIFMRCVGDRVELQCHRDRRNELLRALGGLCMTYATDWHLATGLGNAHPIGNGFAWHPTLGVPFLASSAIKGLLKHWLDEWADGADPRCAQWLGSDEAAGTVAVFDALPIGPVQLVPDVMTPHRGKWYVDGGLAHGDQIDGQRVPADWFEPIPVPFLCVKDATYEFMLAPTSRLPTGDHKEALCQLFEHLDDALRVLGIGAKTDAGYGRMTLVETHD